MLNSQDTRGSIIQLETFQPEECEQLGKKA